MGKTVDGRYRLGWKLHEFGQLVVSGLRLHEVAHEPLERLRRDCDLAVNFVVLDGTDAVYIEQFESVGMARNFRQSGRRAPAHTTSSGKCLLAFAEPSLIDSLIDSLVAAGLGSQRGPRGITSESALRQALARIREDGFVVSIEERAKAITSIGAPVFGRDGHCIAGSRWLDQASPLAATTLTATCEWCAQVRNESAVPWEVPEWLPLRKAEIVRECSQATTWVSW